MHPVKEAAFTVVTSTFKASLMLAEALARASRRGNPAVSAGATVERRRTTSSAPGTARAESGSRETTP
jgi:hypothetical protein